MNKEEKLELAVREITRDIQKYWDPEGTMSNAEKEEKAKMKRVKCPECGIVNRWYAENLPHEISGYQYECLKCGCLFDDQDVFDARRCDPFTLPRTMDKWSENVEPRIGGRKLEGWLNLRQRRRVFEDQEERKRLLAAMDACWWSADDKRAEMGRVKTRFANRVWLMTELDWIAWALMDFSFRSVDEIGLSSSAQRDLGSLGVLWVYQLLELKAEGFWETEACPETTGRVFGLDYDEMKKRAATLRNVQQALAASGIDFVLASCENENGQLENETGTKRA
jgi:predicted RNA-binding Zn-ribbon protein involved in translation (DUF1610 family)